jgi:predicted transcriptional regulator YdeE
MLKVVDLPNRKLLGLSCVFSSATHQNDNGPQIIGALWKEVYQKFFALESSMGLEPVGIGAMWPSESGVPQEMVYFAGYEVADFPATALGLDALSLKAARYAVLEHSGSMAELPAVIRDFYSDLLPKSGFKRAFGMDLGIYHPADLENGMGRVELAAPIA